jgi:hypothetical protein
MLLDFPAPSDIDREMSPSSAVPILANDLGELLTFFREVTRFVLHAGSKRKNSELRMQRGQLSCLRKIEQQDWQTLEQLVAELQVLYQKARTTNLPWIHIHFLPF